MSDAPLFCWHELAGTHHTPGVRWRAWLAAVALAMLSHAGVWFLYTAGDTEQTLPQPLPAVEVSLISLPVPQEPTPLPPRQRPPAQPKPAPVTATPPVASTAPPATEIAESAPEPPVVSEEYPSTPPELNEELTPPLYNAAYLNNPQPRYPLAARRRGIEGTVLIRAQIREDGHCHQVNLSRGSGHALLDQAALEAVKRWRFVPARRGTQSVSAWVVVPITFRLTPSES
ncbi:MAG TPA: energy transducer TonB [Gammaproteobacteria bacterium]